MISKDAVYATRTISNEMIRSALNMVLLKHEIDVVVDLLNDQDKCELYNMCSALEHVVIAHSNFITKMPSLSSVESLAGELEDRLGTMILEKIKGIREMALPLHKDGVIHGYTFG